MKKDGQPSQLDEVLGNLLPLSGNKGHGNVKE
jgi:hypothetical protein